MTTRDPAGKASEPQLIRASLFVFPVVHLLAVATSAAATRDWPSACTRWDRPVDAMHGDRLKETGREIQNGDRSKERN